MEVGAEIIAAIGGTTLLAAMAFRQMMATVIKLNDELVETIEERRHSEAQRDALQAKVIELETRLVVMQSRLETQELEIQALQQRLQESDEIIAQL